MVLLRMYIQADIHERVRRGSKGKVEWGKCIVYGKEPLIDVVDRNK